MTIPATALAALLVIASAAHADRITMRGTTIPLPPTTIERIAAGRIHHVDARGRTQQVELARIATISFDNLEALDEAERALAAEDYERATLKFLQALLDAETDAQRIWVKSRLVRMHDALQEYVQAASHLASIVLIEDHPYWRGFEPVRDPGDTFYAAAAEAMDRLNAARRRARHPEVVAMLDRMIQRVEPIHRQLSGQYEAASIVLDATLSGFDVARIRDDELVPGGERDKLDPPDDSPQPDDEPETEYEPQSPAAIEAMLAAHRWHEARELCEEISRDPGDRDLAEFLHQYGRALAGTGEHHNAAVMFTRCAILYPGTAHALSSLTETAIIYRDIFNNAETSQRLLERAIREADRLGNRENAHRARQLLQQF